MFSTGDKDNPFAERGVLRVLQIEDSPGDAALALRQLTKGGYAVRAHRVENAADLRAALSSQTWDVILADYHLPGFDAPGALAIVLGGGFDVPFIVISGAIGEDAAVEMMKSGAHDYLLKDNLARLVPAVKREVREAQIRCQRRQQEEVRLRLARELEAQYEAQKQTLRELESAVAQKTALLKELHHRVKNNLAVVSALLDMKADASGNAEVKTALEESAQRVQSIAFVHELLYASNTPDRIDFGSYAEKLAEGLESTLAVEPGLISVQVEAEPVEMRIDQAVPCALILNELVTNSFKYAFPDRRPGHVLISLRETGRGCLQLAVEDNGIGCPPEKANGHGDSLGMKLVNILAHQLNGSLQREECRGSRFVLRLPSGSAQFAACAANTE